MTRISTSEAAERLGVTAETVILMGKRGDLDMIDVAPKDAYRPRYRITVESIDQYESDRRASGGFRATRRSAGAA